MPVLSTLKTLEGSVKTAIGLLAMSILFATSANASLIGSSVQGTISGFVTDFASNTAIVRGESATEFQTPFFQPDPCVTLRGSFREANGTLLQLGWSRGCSFGNDIGPVTWTFSELRLVDDPSAVLVAIEDEGNFINPFEIESFSLTGDHSVEIVTQPQSYSNGGTTRFHNFRLRFESTAVSEPSTLVLLCIGLGGLISMRQRRKIPKTRLSHT